MNHPTSSRPPYFRPANERYARRNGFEEYNRQFPTEFLSEGEAIERQDFARFVIREMGSFFPSLEEMKREAEAPETVNSVTERIKRLKSEYAQQISKLSRYYAQQVRDDALDRYMQTDDLKYFEIDDHAAAARANDEWSIYYMKLESLFKQYEQNRDRIQNDIIIRTQYDYLQELLQLYARRQQLEIAQSQGIRRGTQFPDTIDAYRKLKGIDSGGQLLLVAKFLMADEGKRRQMREASQWSLRQTEPLIEEYNKNEAFQTEVKKLVKDYEAKDPRSRKRTLPG